VRIEYIGEQMRTEGADERDETEPAYLALWRSAGLLSYDS